MKILLLRDAGSVRRSIEQYLIARGDDLTICADGGTALEFAAEQAFPVILLDWNTSGLNGAAFCRKLRKLPGADCTNVLVFADEATRKRLGEILDSGADDFVAEPVDLENLGLRLAVAARRAVKKAARMSAEKSQHFLASIVDSTDLAVIGLDLHGRVISWNQGAAQIFGFSEIEALRKDIVHLLPDDCEAETDNLIDRLSRGETVGGFETVRYRKDGEAIDVAMNVAPIRGESDEIVAVAMIARDITDSKRLERALRESEKSLAQANRDLRRLAHHDGLTGLPNRRIFDQRVMSEWKRGRRDKSPLSLIMLDIDYFKRYNDTFGHLRGDDCLRKIAETISTIVTRPADLVARYGGEEFCVILPSTEIEGAKRIAKIMRVRVEAMGIVTSHEPDSKPVTISLGVASMVPREGATPDDLIAAADRALYQAKADGRNTVCVAEQMAVHYANSPPCQSASGGPIGHGGSAAIPLEPKTA